MANAFYIQDANEIFPIFGVTSLDEAKRCVDEKYHAKIVETNERVLMNPNTGSVDFESGWEDTEGLIEVRYSVDDEAWVEA